MSRKQKKNYFDYVPVCAPEHSWDVNEKNLVVLHVENKMIQSVRAERLWEESDPGDGRQEEHSEKNTEQK